MGRSNQKARASEAPTIDQIRRALLERARAFAELKGCSLATVSDICAGDGKFLSDCDSGKNFTVERYQKVMDALLANWPKEHAA